jgi:hypothetical protein
MSSVIFANKDASMDDVEFEWYDGYWHQETGSNIKEINKNDGALLCEEFNQERKTKNLLIGYGLKNLYGTLVYEVAKVKKQRFYYDSYESDFGDGHYPFIKYDPKYTSCIDYYFMLNNEDLWIQLNGRNIVGIDGDDGRKDALDALNNGPDKGRGIKNKHGLIIYINFSSESQDKI